jgi:hypothetical protein
MSHWEIISKLKEKYTFKAINMKSIKENPTGEMGLFSF